MRFRDFLFGMLVGAAAGILFAPESGRRSRALIKDKTVKYSHDATDYVDRKSRHLANKAKGYGHEMKDAYKRMTGRVKEEIEEETPVEA